MNKIKLAIVDDHEMTRKATTKLLNLENDMEVILEAENGIDLLQKINESNPNIILMDIQMPGMNGIDATERVLSQYPNIKIIALTQFDNEQNIIKMYSRGVKSFLNKGGNPAELFKAIRVVNHGGAYLTDEGLSIIKVHLQEYIGTKLQETTQISQQFFFTPQEYKLVRLLKQGKTSKEIAIDLGLTVSTIRTYRERLLKKTSTKNVTELLNLPYTLKKS